MKKLILLFITVIAIVFSASSQEISKNALGLRLGDSEGFGAEINYQLSTGGNERLEFGLGWRDKKNYNAAKIIGLYQWVWSISGDFNWYAGGGAGFSFYSFENDDIDSETDFFVAGDVGIEYSFDFPLLLSLDLRPEIGFGAINDDLDIGIGLGVRYQF